MAELLQESIPTRNRGDKMEKLMFSLRTENLRTISLEAKRRGISIQELLRAVIIPDWVSRNIATYSVEPLMHRPVYDKSRLR